MTRLRTMRGSDAGVSLVFALLFLTIVGIFIAAALTKSVNTSGSVTTLRSRASLQYTLDGGVDRAYEVLTDELKAGSPTSCATAGATSTLSPFSLNSQTAALSCTTTSGRVATSSDGTTSTYAMIVTDPSDDAFTSSSGTSGVLKVGGSVYLNGKVNDSAIKKPIEVTSGDLVSPASRSTCAADLAGLTQISLTGTGQLKACTEQTLAQAEPTVVLPAAPTVDLWTLPLVGSPLVTLGSGVKQGNCQVFYPGRYSKAPAIAADNYFVSGLYYFDGTGAVPQFQITGDSSVIGGQRSVSTDSPVPAGNCASMTDATAMGLSGVSAAAATVLPYKFPYGTTWVFGGAASLDFAKGSVTLFTPPAGSSTSPVSMVGVSATANGYTKKTDSSALLTGGNNNTSMTMNAKLFAPTTTVVVFSTNNTYAAVAGGVVAFRIDLKASASGSGGLVITAPGGFSNPPPPYRTVKVVTTDSSGGTPATNSAVATISNFSPYTVHVLSWRTG